MGYKISDTDRDSFITKLANFLTNNVIHDMCCAIENANLDINIITDKFISIFKQAGEDFQKKPKVTRSNNQPWFDSELQQLKREKHKTLRRFRLSRSNEDLNIYLHSRNVFKNVIKTKKDKYHQKKLDSLLASVNESKSFWSKLKYMTGRKVKQINNITTEQWLEHFEKLFNSGVELDANHENDFDITLDEPNDEVEDHLFNSDITDEEILIAVKQMKKGKAAGLDSIIPEMFIYGIECLLPLINRFFNRLFSLGEYPESWYNSIIVTLHKKGDVNDGNNYRGISLQSVFSKLYASIINRRLSFFAQIYGKISEAQAGFKPGYSTIDNAFVLRALVECRLAKKRGKLYVGFVDFRRPSIQLIGLFFGTF